MILGFLFLISVVFTTTVACLLSLINIGSSTPFNDVISLVINGFYLYLICNGLLLWRRCTGAIKTPCDSSLHSSNTEDGGRLTWGPWRVPRALGIAINAFGCLYMAVILFFSFWPPETPTTAATMNFSSLVTGSVIIPCILYYFLRAQKFYTGPVTEIDIHR